MSLKIGISSEYLRLIEADLRQPSGPVEFALKTLLSEEESLAELIYVNMPWVGETYKELASQLAEKIVRAGYKKLERD